MDNRFLENPILNSPYPYPTRHWELDGEGQPTREIIESPRSAGFISPVPMPKKRSGPAAAAGEDSRPFDEGKGLTIREQRHERYAEIVTGHGEVSGTPGSRAARRKQAGGEPLQ